MRDLLALLRRHPLLRLLLRNMSIGYGLSAALVGVMLVFDVGGFRAMTIGHGLAAVPLLLWFFVGLTFASAQMGMAVMSLTEDPPPPPGGKRIKIETLTPAPVKQQA